MKIIKKIMLFIMLISVSLSLGIKDISKNHSVSMLDNNKNIQLVEVKEESVLGDIFNNIIEMFTRIVNILLAGNFSSDDNKKESPEQETSKSLTTVAIEKINAYNKNPLTIKLQLGKLNNTTCNVISNGKLNENDVTNDNLVSCIALAQQGINGVDCYAFVRAVYKAARGISLSDYARLTENSNGLKKLSSGSKGAIVQFYNGSGHKHSAIYIDNNTVVNGGWHSSKSVEVTTLSGAGQGYSWNNKYFFK